MTTKAIPINVVDPREPFGIDLDVVPKADPIRIWRGSDAPFKYQSIAGGRYCMWIATIPEHYQDYCYQDWLLYFAPVCESHKIGSELVIIGFPLTTA